MIGTDSGMVVAVTWCVEWSWLWQWCSVVVVCGMWYGRGSGSGTARGVLWL